MGKGFFRQDDLVSKKIQKGNSKTAYCGKCGLYKTCMSPQMKPSGNFKYPFMSLAEAPGEGEDYRNEQLVKDAGQFHRRKLRAFGFHIDDGIKDNAIKCFINPKVKVYTSHGYKKINDVMVGDLVLTHKGRFRKVISRTHDKNLYVNEYIRVTFKTKNGKFATYSVTKDHRFLKNKLWKFATDLKIGDKVKILGEICENCGKVFPIKPEKFDDTNHRKFCSHECKNKVITPNSEKVSKNMRKQYVEGKRNRHQITKKANRKVRQLSKKGLWGWNGGEVDYSNIAKKRQCKNQLSKNNRKIIGYGEKEFSRYLSQQNIDFVSQFAIDKYNYDFFIPAYNLLIEIDNPQRDYQTVVKKRKKEKDDLAKNNNYEIIRLSSNNPIKEFKRIINNHSGNYYFCDVEVESVEHIKSNRNYKLYSLEVEEDASFIAGGIVNHNCHPPENKTPTMTQIKCCRPKLEDTINYYKPHVILAMGEVALKALISHKFDKDIGGIGRWRGAMIPDREYKAWICPMFHPSYCIRKTTPEIAEKYYEEDLKHALNLLNTPLPYYVYEDEESKIEILKHPKEINKFLQKMLHYDDIQLTAYDYETTGLKPYREGHKIRTCSISYGPDHAVAFPMIQSLEFDKLFKRYCASTEIKKIAANAPFERDWSCVCLGAEVNGLFFDTQIGAHFLDNRPRITSLEFQNYINFGIEPYDSEVKEYLKSKDANGKEGSGNDFNNIFKADLRKLLTYNGMDSMTEFRLALVQMDRIGIDYSYLYSGLRGVDLAPQYPDLKDKGGKDEEEESSQKKGKKKRKIKKRKEKIKE